MPYYNAGILRIYDGSNYTNCNLLQSISFDIQTNRVDNIYQQEYLPEARPYGSYPLVTCNIDYLQGNKIIENALGLVSGESILSNLQKSKSLGNGLYNFEMIIKDPCGIEASGALITFKSGVLKDYNLSLNLNEIPRSSLGFEALDVSISTTSVPEILAEAKES